MHSAQAGLRFMAAVSNQDTTCHRDPSKFQGASLVLEAHTGSLACLNKPPLLKMVDIPVLFLNFTGSLLRVMPFQGTACFA